MKNIRFACATAGVLAATAAHAQSSVTLYGLIDAGIMYTNNVASGNSHGGLVQATTGAVNGSRFGVRGTEDLGGGLKALFVLENGFNAENGKLGQDGRLFGRFAYVGLSDNRFGTLTIGRQYDSLVDFVAPLSATAGTFGDASFAHPFDNDNLNHSLRINNAIKYTSNTYAGLKFGGMYAMSNSTDFATNRAYSFGASYTRGPLNVAAGYLQINGSKGTTAGSPGAVDIVESAANGKGGFSLGADRMRSYGGGLNYAFGPATLGFVYTRAEYENTASFGSTGGTVRFNSYELNGKYQLTPAFSVGGAYTYTDGHVENTVKYGSDPKWHQVDLMAVYRLSVRTDVYLEGMYQHASGRNYVAMINTAGGASSTGNQVVAAVGLRTRF
ncbi:outer membrane porin [Burkholderia pseudomallei]|uniref:porin n=1 Tax=Burkholderia pseudomallei TaxID=28450 RepID=UPI00016AB6CD|nr:porin [Burkholderia pseudomallei]MBF3445685.1 porin [Burkholderia pseudomallei]MBF3809147.1 porin [Burkholderia pseudomallei]MBF3838856.1 porin [Burkholderia pseudomallei]MBF4083528.1 porin [Burkholderia pseudomallei]MPT63280.1 porin [Burkholderia pseudomallei]